MRPAGEKEKADYSKAAPFLLPCTEPVSPYYWLQPIKLVGGRHHTASKIDRQPHRGSHVRQELQHFVQFHRQVSAALSALEANGNFCMLCIIA